jgi:hypothetical protein
VLLIRLSTRRARNAKHVPGRLRARFHMQRDLPVSRA